MLERQGFEGELVVTGDLDRALDGADFVLVQIRVGGQAARLSDETVPLACGCIGQETTGAGGLAKALRTVPVVLEIAAAGARARPRTRGSSTSRTPSASSPARCSTPATAPSASATSRSASSARSRRHLGVEPDAVVVDQVGLNHLTWIRAVHVGGRDVLPELMESHGDEIAEQAALPLRLLEELGVVPSSYLQYFYRHDAILGEQLDGTPRAEVVAEIERGLLELYRDPQLNEKPALLEQRGGAFYSEAATGLVASLVSGDGVVHEVDIAQQRHARRPRRRRRRRGAGPRRGRPARPAAAGAARARAARPDAARRRVRAAGRAGGGDGRRVDRA